jgi:hypothetical protein
MTKEVIEYFSDLRFDPSEVGACTPEVRLVGDPGQRGAETPSVNGEVEPNSAGSRGNYTASD